MTDQPTILTGDDLDLVWRFSSGELQLRYGRSGHAPLDPFPCYPHSRRLVDQVVNHCWARWPLARPLTVHAAGYEGTERTNGWCTYDYTWVVDDSHDDGGVWDVTHHIFLSGKRIPPHPAVTAYVVGHEYGHAVIHDVAHQLEVEVEHLVNEYAEVRGLDRHRDASGGRWHNTPFEVLACDWRLLVGELESGYWPHPGVVRPDALQPGGAVATWWNDLYGRLPARSELSGDAA